MEARTDDQPNQTNNDNHDNGDPPARSNGSDQRLCSGNDGFDGGSGSLDRRLNAPQLLLLLHGQSAPQF